MAELDSLYRRKAAYWPGIYDSIFGAATTAAVLAFGDQKFGGKVNATTFTTVRGGSTGLEATCTWSEAPSAFDTDFDLTDPANWLGCIPILTFNGTDEEADTPDDTFWTRAQASFTVGAWVRITAATGTPAILAKWTTTTGREWLFRLSSGKPQLLLGDESVPIFPSYLADTALVLNTWHHVVITKSTGSGATAMDDVIVYVDGSAVAGTASNEATFVNTENGTGVVSLGKDNDNAGAAENFFSGKMLGGPIGPFFNQSALSAPSVKNIYRAGVHATGQG